MANDSTKVRVAVTGSFYWDKTGAATAPTGTASSLVSGHKDLGYVSEDGLELTLPDGGDVQNLRAWQGNAIVRTIRSLSEDNPQIQLTLIETKLEVIEAAFGVTVTQTSTEGSFEYDITDQRSAGRLVLDVVDGAELIRCYGPRAFVSGVGGIKFASTEEIGYQLTIDLERDSTAGYNFKSWMTALKT